MGIGLSENIKQHNYAVNKYVSAHTHMYICICVCIYNCLYVYIYIYKLFQSTESRLRAGAPVFYRAVAVNIGP